MCADTQARLTTVPITLRLAAQVFAEQSNPLQVSQSEMTKALQLCEI